MNKKALIIMTVATLFTLTACATENIKSNPDSGNDVANQTEATYQKISGEDAKNMMEDGNPFILLDVRTDEEFKENRIEGAILIPDYEIVSRVEKELVDKDARILIYCRSGRRSALAAKEMINMGYTNVYDFGGIIDWTYDTVNG